MRVLVTDAGRGSAISIIRSLGRRGAHVVAADSNRRSPGFFSRYVAARVVHPSTRNDPTRAVEGILDATRRHEIDVVVPVGEDFVMLLSQARGRFTDRAKLALPEPEALAAARDKQATVDLARRLGIPVPRTALVAAAAEAVRQAPSLGWPIVLKPQVSRALRRDGRVDAFGVTYALDSTALSRQMEWYEGRCPVLLQEYNRGEGHGIGLLMAHGRPLLAFQHRRLREVPITGGPSSFRESVSLDPTLYEYSTRLLGALDWTGPAMVEFKLTDDGPKLMEVNGRIWGSLPLTVKSGLDLPSRMVDLFLADGAAGAAPPTTTYTVGVRSRDLNLELVWIAEVLSPKRKYPFLETPRRRQALRVALRLLDPRDGFDVFDLSDLRPGLVEIANIAASIPQRTAERARRDEPQT
jgi:predicted ATP-grasp superfamily ATP-dependent carboligase